MGSVTCHNGASSTAMPDSPDCQRGAGVSSFQEDKCPELYSPPMVLIHSSPQTKQPLCVVFLLRQFVNGCNARRCPRLVWIVVAGNCSGSSTLRRPSALPVSEPAETRTSGACQRRIPPGHERQTARYFSPPMEAVMPEYAHEPSCVARMLDGEYDPAAYTATAKGTA